MVNDGPARELALGPRALYPLKAGLTRARSLSWLARTRGRADESGIRIVFYHRVSDDRDELAVTRRAFTEQMDFLAGEGYGVVDVAEVARRLRDGSTGGRVIGLSFDDAYLDVGENAVPVLERHGFRGTVFVATGVTDGTARFTWYDRQPALLSWDDIRALDGGAVVFGAHTITHPNLRALGDEEARGEIAGGKSVLEERLGREVDVFCYPAGVYSGRDLDLVREAGFFAAVTCEPGINTADTDLLALRRRQVDARDSMLDFRAKVGGGHDSPLPLRSAYRRVRYGTEALCGAELLALASKLA